MPWPYLGLNIVYSSKIVDRSLLHYAPWLKFYYYCSLALQLRPPGKEHSGRQSGLWLIAKSSPFISAKSNFHEIFELAGCRSQD